MEKSPLYHDLFVHLLFTHFWSNRFSTKQNQTLRFSLSGPERRWGETCRTAPPRCCGRASLLPSVTLLRLREDLSSYKVDRVLWTRPAMTTACALLSFGGHQLYVLELFISAGVPGAGPGACGGHSEGEGGGGELRKRLLGDFRCTVFAL